MKLGTTTISHIRNQHDMNEVVKALNLSSNHVIIKPNWVDGLDGSHTEAKALDMFLTAAKRPATIVESYTFWRTEKSFNNQGDYFSSKEATVNTGIKHWEHFKRQDQWFLKKDGIDKVLKKHGAKYLNITNEVWKGKTVKHETIKALVDQNYSPIRFPQLYSYIPEKLYKLKGSDFISFSKAKSGSDYGPSLSIKNLFGLIPDPTRAPAYHTGKNEVNLVKSIIDIHKIYGSLFRMKFIVDGIFTAGFMNWDTMRFIPTNKWGVIAVGDNGLEVDSIGSQLLQQNFKGPMAELMKEYEKTFGGTGTDTSLVPDKYKVDLNAD